MVIVCSNEDKYIEDIEEFDIHVSILEWTLDTYQQIIENLNIHDSR
mgnify:CR=1 FL=1